MRGLNYHVCIRHLRVDETLAASEMYGVGPGLLYTSQDVFGFDEVARIGEGFAIDGLIENCWLVAERSRGPESFVA